MTDELPLAGKRIVVTRAAHQSGTLKAALQTLGADVLLCPMIAIAPPTDAELLQRARQEFSLYDIVIVLSSNGAQALAGVRQGRAQILTVGLSTLHILQQLGLEAGVPDNVSSARELLAHLRGHVAGKRILIIAADDNDGALALGLREAGARVTQAGAYRSEIPTDADVSIRALFTPQFVADTVTFASGRTAENFYEVLARNGLMLPAHVVTASIGPETTAALQRLGYPPTVEAREQSAKLLAAAVADGFRLKQ